MLALILCCSTKSCPRERREKLILPLGTSLLFVPRPRLDFLIRDSPAKARAKQALDGRSSFRPLTPAAMAVSNSPMPGGVRKVLGVEGHAIFLALGAIFHFLAQEMM